MANNTSRPDWLALDNHDCPTQVVVTLTRSYTFTGGASATVTLREPTVADNLNLPDDMVLREIAVFARIGDLAPEDIHKLASRDYFRVQKAYQCFLD